MKKFKEGDTIRLKADMDSGRTYEVVFVGDRVAHGQRSDDKAGPWAHAFVLSRPENYKLVHRPTKKDREIAQLQAMLGEAEKGLSEERAHARMRQVDIDTALLKAGFVRIDLLREATVQTDHCGDGFNEFYNVRLLMNGDAIREVLRRWVG